MTPVKTGRKFHHKSRYGCAPCKQRRIKCDEKKPVCNNCVRRSVDCSFKYSEPTGTTISVPAPLSHSLRALPFCRGNTRDLELWCHFQIYTAPTFHYPPSVEKLFQQEFPRLATTFPFLGHGLLSIGYIHLAGLSQGTSRKLLAEGAFHVNKALPAYLETIQNITKENSAALFGFALFVVLFTFADVSEQCAFFLRHIKDNPSKEAEATRGLAKAAAQIPRSIHNIFGIFWRCQQWISSGPLSAVIQRYGSPTLSEPLMFWIGVEDDHLARLGRLWVDDPAILPANSCVLSDALSSLRDTFAMVTQLTDVPSLINHGDGETATWSSDLVEIHRHLSTGRLDDIPSPFTWYIRLSPDFISMVEKGSVYAMVILAHHAILLERACCERWWTHRLPYYCVAMAELILGQERRGWIEWPLMVVAERQTHRIN
ncbi:hypothetical protein BDW59DRAFT_96522 [Aspergillus cavernicola]|uniref:Zn(2)-C6 fungal-type domain-containing protein n=1 Tax=Aspergillus cavernicola TaxID=176166 RepID=A0ABR4I8I0_9EURO